MRAREDDKGAPPPPHTTAPLRVGDDGSGTRTPPPRGQSGRVERQRREGAGRTTRPCPKGARAEHDPTGGPPGVRPQGRKGDDGSQTASPPPHLQRDMCRASCLHRARDVLTPDDRQRGRPPPPPPSPPPTQERGEDSEETARGHGGGGAEDRPKRRGERRVASGGDAKEKKTKDANAPEQGQTAGADGTRQEPGSTARDAGKGGTPGEESWEARSNTAANGGGGAG